MSDVIIVGAGHNGLAAAFYLARAGLKPLVLERRQDAGGGATTTEVHPGFRVPAFTHELLLHEQVARDMDLAAHGLRGVAATSEVCALAEDGPALRVSRDGVRTIDNGAAHPEADAYRAWRTTAGNAARVLAPVLESIPPDVDAPAAADLWSLVKAGAAFKALSDSDAYRLLQWLSAPVADVVSDAFTQPLLRAASAAPALIGAFLGPRSAGSMLMLLLREAHMQRAGGHLLQVRGGPGAATAAMAAAARAAGAEIRTEAQVSQILVRDERVAGVVCNGQELAASIVVSSADPRTTMLSLVDAGELPPEFVARVRHVRARGTLAKINLALGALPAFRGVSDPAVLGGRIHIGPTLDYLERAFDHVKYGEPSAEPWLDVSIPSLLDDSLAPAGGHVASIYAHYAPHAPRRLDDDALRDTVLRHAMTVLDRYAPGIAAQVLAARVLTPRDLERELALPGGQIFHGELAPDQLFVMRPSIGYARYATPIRGLFLCGGGTHPGGFFTGVSGRLAAQQIARAWPRRRA